MKYFLVPALWMEEKIQNYFKATSGNSFKGDVVQSLL